MANISMEEMSTFHRIEREMYARLVFGLNRDPIQSMQVIALWLWLEQMGFPTIILKMASLPDSVINILVDEALICFDCLGFGFTPPMASTSTNNDSNNNIPMTENLLETRFSLQFIRENRLQAFTGISRILNEVCIPVFSNIAEEAIAVAPHRNITSGSGGSSSDQNLVGNMMSPYPVPSVGHIAGLHRPLYQRPLTEIPPPAPLLRGTPQARYPSSPQQPHFGFSTGMGGSSSSGGSPQPNVGESSSGTSSYGRLNLINQQPQPQPANFIPEGRSMFVTFSRGHPMRSWEITDFFTRMYGNCIENIYMEEVPPNQQSMYARVVLISPSWMELILDGQVKVKFTINGKQVLVRRYVSRRV